MNEEFIGHKLKIKNSKKTGITLQIDSSSCKNLARKYVVSFDIEKKIEPIKQENISFGEKISKVDFFNRLIRDIQSSEENTREFATAILCDFLEFDIVDFDLKILNIGIEKIIKQIKVEKNINAEHKLVEGLFEFIWHKKISIKTEIELLERLTEIDKYYVWSYLGDEIQEDIKSYDSEILNQYYSKNIEKWKEKDIQMYGTEKMEEYYKKLNN